MAPQQKWHQVFWIHTHCCLRSQSLSRFVMPTLWMETMSSFPPKKNHLDPGCNVYSRYFNILSGQEKEGVNDECVGQWMTTPAFFSSLTVSLTWLSAMDFLDLSSSHIFFSLRSQSKFYNFLVLIFFLFTSPSQSYLVVKGVHGFSLTMLSPPWEQHDLSFPGTWATLTGKPSQLLSSWQPPLPVFSMCCESPTPQVNLPWISAHIITLTWPLNSTPTQQW